MQNIQQTTQATSQRWGGKPGKKFFNGPKWARFRLFIQYEHGNAKYHSFDYHYSFANGIKIKNKSEAVGFQKLLELAHEKTKTTGYRYINIFCNVSNDLDTVTGNFDYLLCTIVKGEIKFKLKQFYKSENEQMLDTKKMIEYKQNLIN